MTSTALAASPATLIKPSRASQYAAAAIGGALLTAAFAQIRIPLGFTPVPATLQTLAVVLCGLAMGRRLGMASQGLYLALGGAGLPVFSGWSGGIIQQGSVIPTLGYLAAFPAGAWVAGLLWEKRSFTSPSAALVAAIAAMAVVHAGGFFWLAVIAASATGPSTALPVALGSGVLPFVGIDAAKAMVAAALIVGGHSASTKVRDFSWR